MERIHSDGQPLCKFTGKEVTHLSAKTVQLPEDFLGAPIWPPFHCFGTPIWPPWRHVHNEKNTCLLICVLCIFKFSTLTYRNLWIFYFMSRLTLINVSLMFVLRGNFCSKKYIYCPIQALLSHYQVNFFFQYEWHSIQLENVELKYNRNHGVHKPQTHRSLEDRPPPIIFRPSWSLKGREVLFSWGQRPLLRYALNERTPHLLTCLFLLCSVYLFKYYSVNTSQVRSEELERSNLGTQSSYPSPCAGPRIKNNAYLFIYGDKRRLKSDLDSLHSKLRHKSNIRNPFLTRQHGQNAGLATSAAAFDDHSDKQLDLFTGVLQLNTLANFVNSQMIFRLPGGILSHCPKQTLFIAPPPKNNNNNNNKMHNYCFQFLLGVTGAPREIEDHG